MIIIKIVYLTIIKDKNLICCLSNKTPSFYTFYLPGYLVSIDPIALSISLNKQGIWKTKYDQGSFGLHTSKEQVSMVVYNHLPLTPSQNETYYLKVFNFYMGSKIRITVKNIWTWYKEEGMIRKESMNSWFPKSMQIKRILSMPGNMNS